MVQCHKCGQTWILKRESVKEIAEKYNIKAKDYGIPWEISLGMMDKDDNTL